MSVARALPFHQRWPALQVFVVDSRKLLYLPIAKNACTTLKTLCVELSDLPPAEKAEILHEVHGQTDGRRTGLQLKDRSLAEVSEVLTAPGWMRFAVVRDPYERLVSAYVEKFVIRRERKGSITAPVVAAMQNAAHPGEADLAKGISFAAFLEFVLSAEHHTLDPHWRRQIDSFDAMACTHLYAMEHLGTLAGDLGRHIGREVRLGSANRKRIAPVRRARGVCDLLPGDLDAPETLHPDSFFDADSRARVAVAFAADLTLHRTVLRENAQRRAGEQAAPTPRSLRKRLSLNGVRRLISG